MKKLSTRKQIAIVISVAVVLTIFEIGYVKVLQAKYRRDETTKQQKVEAHIKLNQVKFDPAPDIDLDNLWKLVNDERTKNGLEPLSRNPMLDQAAQAKCDDMVAKDYWSHDSPNGEEPWVFIDNVGISFHRAGENLAYGQSNSEGVVSSWMNSEGHKKNIFNGYYTDVGYAQCKYGSNSKFGRWTLVVQEFVQPY